MNNNNMLPALNNQSYDGRFDKPSFNWTENDYKVWNMEQSLKVWMTGNGFYFIDVSCYNVNGNVGYIGK